MATLFCEACRKLNWMTFIKPRVESRTPVSKRGKQESFLPSVYVSYDDSQLLLGGLVANGLQCVID
jgi:hypothetical protein